MKLTSLRVIGFQAFADSGAISLAGGVNLIIGQNNSGKSSLLRGLLPQYPDDRHRNPDRWEQFRLPLSDVQMTIELTGAELETEILRTGETHLPIPLTAAAQEYAEHIFAMSSLLFNVRHGPGSNFSADYPAHGQFSYNPGDQQTCVIVRRENGQLAFTRQYKSDDSLPSVVFSKWSTDMFYFTAERLNVGEAPSGYAERLTSNASNLPNVLHTLHNRRGDVFQRIVGHLREIFSTVGNVSVPTKPDNNILEIRLWPTEAMERAELSFPLNLSGTGVAQIIALLTAISTMEAAVIVIDEINSFLHPAAVKALLRILQAEYGQHQYIISTHSPDVIAFSGARTIHLVKRDGYDSTVEQLDLEQVEHLRRVADHLGVSMADVFAADHVVWVEGPTEEKCFPFLYNELVGSVPRGVVFSSVAATGDFNSKKRDPAIVYEVYRRLSSAVANLVVSVVFSFDRETLDQTQRKKMERDAGGLLHFLPRRHIECYLIDPPAISAFIAAKDPSSANTATPEAVGSALKQWASDKRFRIREWQDDLEDEEWLAAVDAANLIEVVCAELSEHRAAFDKKDDTLFLMQHIVEHEREKLRPLATYVQDLVSNVSPPVAATPSHG